MEEIKYFFSYARKDSEFVLKLARELRAVGAKLWLDQLDIVGGQRWDRTIEEALETCQGMIAVLSPESLASTNVMDEVSYALEEGKLVVPVIIRPCDIPFRLRRVQHIDFTADYDVGFSQLLRALLRIDKPPVLTKHVGPDIQSPSAAATSRSFTFDWKYVFFALDGRISRRQYWLSGLVSLPIFGLLDLLILALTGANSPGASMKTRSTATATYFVITLYPSIAIMLKRLHDFNWSGWWTIPLAFLSFISLISSRVAAESEASEEVAVSSVLAILFFFPLILLGIRRGDSGVNRFGPPPFG